MEKETGRIYLCPKCKADLKIKSLKTGLQPLYRFNPDVDANTEPSHDAWLWRVAKQFTAPFSSAELFETYQVHRAAEIEQAKRVTVAEGAKKSDIDTSMYVYSTIRARIQKWKKDGLILPCEEKRKPELVTCPACGETSDPHGVVGGFTSDRKNKAATRTLAKIARPLHKATLAEEVWAAINTIEGIFTPEDVAALCPNVSFSTVRQRIYKWSTEGKLKDVEIGSYKRTTKWTKKPRV